MNKILILISMFMLAAPAMASSSCDGQSITCPGMGCGSHGGYQNYKDANECSDEFDSKAGCYYQRGVCSLGGGSGGSHGQKGCSSSDVVSCPGMGCGGRDGYERYSYANECSNEFDSANGCYYQAGSCTK